MHAPGTMVQRSDPTENAANRRFYAINPRRGFCLPQFPLITFVLGASLYWALAGFKRGVGW
jgi:hypothetical protein